MRASLKTGACLAAITLGMEALAILPGRVALGGAQEQFGRSPLEFVIAGTFRDLSDLALPVGLVTLVVLAVTLSLRRVQTDVVRLRAMRIVVGLLSIVGVLLWLSSSAAAEFKIQRGVDATWFDVEIASRSSSFASTFVEFLRLRRHFVPGVLAFAASAFVLSLVYRRSRGWVMSSRSMLLCGFVAVTFGGWGCALVPLDPRVRAFRTIGDRNVVGEPFPNLFTTLGRSHDNVRLGMKGLIATATFPPEHAHGGEGLLGVPTTTRTGVDCAIHPFARSFLEDGVEPARRDTGGFHPLDEPVARALARLDALSAEIYEGRTTPIDLWQVMMESFRADDIHALNPSAPRGMAPFMNGLYESQARREGSVLAARTMWQAGARTSQGLSSYMCGMGMLSYGLSFTRDFGAIPARCLPDVLADAGFEPFFLYGGVASFDGMDDFFRHHGSRHVEGQLQWPRSAPTGECGVSDRALVGFSAELAAKTDADRARYIVLMTGSNHVPYRRPTDVPDEIESRISMIEKSPTFHGSADDARRLRTYAYSDQAASELLAAIGPNLSRSIVVVGSDHSTSDNYVWDGIPEWPLHGARGRIPWAIVLPDALIASSARPEKVRELAREVSDALDAAAWSQNDSATLLLALVSHAPGMRSMPADKRWHTLGGQRTSPYFVPPRPPASTVGHQPRVVGIDAAAIVLGVDDDATSLYPVETASYVRGADELHTVAPSLIPIAATLSGFLNGFAAQCPR